jgi:nitrite reductase/ring-hydroxylating ferredoxin subunit
LGGSGSFFIRSATRRRWLRRSRGGLARGLLLRHNGHLHALHDRCSHRGCLLSRGEVEGESITCLCHGSRFDLRDGSIERGPATAPQPVFETRDREGAVEVRLPAPA